MSATLVVNEVYLSLQGESTFAGLPCIFVRLTACNLRCSYCDTAYAFTEGKKRELEDVLAEIRLKAERFEKGGTNAPSPGTLGNEVLPHHEPRENKLPLSPAQWLPKPATSQLPNKLSALRALWSPFVPQGEREKSLPQRSPFVLAGISRLPLVELTGGEPLLQANSLLLMEGLCDEGFTVLLETSGAHDISKVDPRVRRIMDLKCPSSGEVARNLWENLAHLKATDEIKFVIGTVEDYEWAARQIAEHQLAAICPLLMSWVQPLAPEQQDKSLKPVPAGQTAISRRELAERIIADALPVRFQAQLHKIIWPAEKRGV